MQKKTGREYEEQYKAAQKRWRDTHREQRAAYAKKYRKEHPGRDYTKEYQRRLRWRKAHRYLNLAGEIPGRPLETTVFTHSDLMNASPEKLISITNAILAGRCEITAVS